MTNKPLLIGIVAGEISGDILGEGLIIELKKKYPKAEFVGIGGSKMIAQGCKSLFELEQLSIMGLVEVLQHLPKLFKIKSALVKYFLQNPPDIFIGIDVPDFNLRLERTLKDHGIKTVHYVSPSVWAWRQNRIYDIAKATNLVLALLPFEKEFYDKFNVPCTFIGHRLADHIKLTDSNDLSTLETDKYNARLKLGLEHKKWLAVLVGSRNSELKMLATSFIKACSILHEKDPNLGFVVAIAHEKLKPQFEQIWHNTASHLSFTLINDTAHDVICASDAVMLASGTVALECMLINRPMVVGYKVNSLTGYLASKMLKIDHVSLPNILTQHFASKNMLTDPQLVTELLQDNCTPEKLAEHTWQLLTTDNSRLQRQFSLLHQLIRKNSDHSAACAVLSLLP